MDTPIKTQSDRVEFYIDDQHPQINDNIQYLHLTHAQSLDNAGCIEIDLHNCLDYTMERDQILQIAISKLRYNGVLRINGIDLDMVMYNAISGNLNIQQAQQLLYSGKLSADTYENVVAKLKQAQLTIINESLTDNQYFIAAKRELKTN